jgi:hypothetical protein
MMSPQFQVAGSRRGRNMVRSRSEVKSASLGRLGAWRGSHTHEIEPDDADQDQIDRDDVV